MILYLSTLLIPVFLTIRGLKKIPYFSDANEWTILKEFLAIFIILSSVGITMYFAGFLYEEPSQRWNLPTFIDSCLRGMLFGMIPFLFFTATNYRHFFVSEIIKNFKPAAEASSLQSERLIKIESQLKKEDLSFYPSQFIYAESDGNYVVFHLNVNNQIQKKIIRNSIANIESQLSAYPFLIRTHRAYIVNVKQVVSQKGNTLVYHLKLSGIDKVVPVSRQNIRDFDQLLKQFR
jgi:hypothetical protein